VQVSIAAQTIKDALVVPASAIFKNADGADFVMLAGADDKAKSQIVQVGIRTATLAQITGGVKAGDQVISSGGYALPDGTAIKAEAGSGENSSGSGAEGKDDKKDDAGAPAGKTKE
jgi:multidrug efflux pump subunit AcrA (membrane-fusion protein)